MPVVRPIITNWTAGEFSEQLYGRVDLAKYGNAAAEVFNKIVRPHGGVRRRGGTRFIHGTRRTGGQHDPSSRLVPFVFSTTQSYLLEFGGNYIRFFRNGGIIFDRQLPILGIARTPSTHITFTGPHGLSVGDPVVVTGVSGMTELNNREAVITAIGSDIIALNIDSTGFGNHAGGGTVSRIYEIGSYYDALDVEGLQFTQNADTLFIFHPLWPIGRLVRNDHAAWTFSFAPYEEGPFLEMNTEDAARLSINVSFGSGIMSCPVDIFDGGHVGSIWRIWEQSSGTTFGYTRWAPGGLQNAAVDALYEHNGNVYRVLGGANGSLPSEIKNDAAFPTHTSGTVEVYIGGSGGGTASIVNVRYEHSGYCLVRINSVIDTKNANVTLLGKYFTPYTALAGRSTSRWQEGVWSDLNGYPRAGAFHEQRFIAASSPFKPATIWASKTGSFLNFQDGDEDDRAYTYTLAADQVDAIKYMSPGGRGVTLLTTSSEYVLRASRSDEAITPTNVRIARETSYGTANVEPLRIGPVVLFAQRAGDPANPPRRIREHVYNFQTDSYVAPDMTILSEHITASGIVRGAFQQHPDMVIWYALASGSFIGMTYERDQQVIGWHRHQLGGGGLVQDIVSLPGVHGDEIYMIVQRVIGGTTYRFIELLTEGLADDASLEEATFLDSHLTYAGPAVSRLSGAAHLDGELVDLLIDGNALGPVRVSAGIIDLPRPGARVCVGYGYVSRLRTLRLEAGAAQGSTAQSRVQKVSEVAVRFHRTVGGRVGPSLDRMQPIRFRDVDIPIGATLPMFTGDKIVDFDADWDRGQQIILEQERPLPMHALCMMVQMRVN
jgi:hypothetical protein